MKPVLRGYLVLVAFLVAGGVAAWYILWHVTFNNCCGATDCTEDQYRTGAICVGVTLGLIAGCWSSVVIRRRQFIHAILFSAAAMCVGIAVCVTTQSTACSLERCDAFYQWTEKHGVVWLSHAAFWVSYWIIEAIYFWLIPQLVALLFATAVTQFLRARYPAWEAKHPSLAVTRRRVAFASCGFTLLCLAILVLTPIKSVLLGNMLFCWEGRLLLKLGADPQAVSRYDVPVLNKAAAWGDDRLVSDLVSRGASVTCREDSGETPLHRAVANGHFAIARTLLDHGANVNDAGSYEGTPLHCAAIYGQTRIAKLLLARGADIHVRDRNGNTALCYACTTYNHWDIAKILLSRETSLASMPDVAGVCVGAAASVGKLRMVKMLVRKGASVNTTEDTTPPLCLAANGRHLDTVRFLLECGADPNAVSRPERWTAVHYAIMGRSKAIVQLLLKHGAETNTRDRDGYTPLHLAVRYFPDVVEALLVNGADVNVRIGRGETPLGLVGDDRKTAAILLRHGAHK